MKVHFIIPYSNTKDLGKAYNDAMNLIPDGDAACIIDYDVLMLTHDTPNVIRQYANDYPNDVLTCFTNRIHPLNTEQLLKGVVDNSPNITEHLVIANNRIKNDHTATEITEHFSGYLFVLPKHIWKENKFKEGAGCLGIDSDFFKLLKTNNIKVKRMDRVYVWHTYRFLQGINDKTHLK